MPNYPAGTGPGPNLDLVEFGDDTDPDGLVIGSKDAKALLIVVPIEARDGLSREVAAVE